MCIKQVKICMTAYYYRKLTAYDIFPSHPSTVKTNTYLNHNIHIKATDSSKIRAFCPKWSKLDTACVWPLKMQQTWYIILPIEKHGAVKRYGICNCLTYDQANQAENHVLTLSTSFTSDGFVYKLRVSYAIQSAASDKLRKGIETRLRSVELLGFHHVSQKK